MGPISAGLRLGYTASSSERSDAVSDLTGPGIEDQTFRTYGMVVLFPIYANHQAIFPKMSSTQELRYASRLIERY